jgi:tRNA1Val (adenine37-N6)-methyltransferase
MAINTAETIDTILGGGLTMVQPFSGYRFSIDSILLARFAAPRRRDSVLELGAGCGVVSVMLAALHRPRDIAALELQPELAAMLSRNAAANGFAMIRPVCADLRARRIEGLAPASFDYVVANPPYREPRAGRESPIEGRRIARSSGASLTDFIAAAARYAANGARVAMVFTAGRTAELVAAMTARSLEPKRIRFVHPAPASPASAILIEARKGGGVETRIEPPLMIYDRSGVYSGEAREMLGGDLARHRVRE